MSAPFSSPSSADQDLSNFTTGSIIGGIANRRAAEFAAQQRNRDADTVSTVSSMSGTTAGSKRQPRRSFRQSQSERNTDFSSSSDDDSDNLLGRDLMGVTASGRRDMPPPQHRKRRREASLGTSSDEEDNRATRRHKRQRVERDDDSDREHVSRQHRRQASPVRKQRRLYREEEGSDSDSGIDDEDAIERRDASFARRMADRTQQRQPAQQNANRHLYGTQPRHAKRRRADAALSEAHRDPAVREIRRMQHTTHRLIPKLPFARLVKDLSDTVCESMGLVEAFKWRSEALDALHEAAESYLTTVMERSNWCAAHAKRVTLTTTDVQLSRRLSEKDVCPTWVQSGASDYGDDSSDDEGDF